MKQKKAKSKERHSQGTTASSKGSVPRIATLRKCRSIEGGPKKPLWGVLKGFVLTRGELLHPSPIVGFPDQGNADEAPDF
jgi:hypothetical protein